MITDSQAIKQVSAKTPKNIKLTTFSIIYAADKSDIVEMATGAAQGEGTANTNFVPDGKFAPDIYAHV